MCATLSRLCYNHQFLAFFCHYVFFIGVSVVDVPLDKRICLVGSLASDNNLHNSAKSFDVPVLTSVSGLEFTDNEHTCKTVFVLDSFDDDVFKALFKLRQCILGPTALQQLAIKKEKLPDNIRPLFNLSMGGVVVCFTGFRNKEDLVSYCLYV